jgi:hypothetical protein
MQNGHGKKQTSDEIGKEKKKKPKRDDKTNSGGQSDRRNRRTLASPSFPIGGGSELITDESEQTAKALW